MSWIEEALEDKSMRDQWMDIFMTQLNTWRAQGFHDVEIYHVLYGIHQDNQLWPLFDYWCETFLDWDDEVGGNR